MVASSPSSHYGPNLGRLATSHLSGGAGGWKSPRPDLARGRVGQPLGLLYKPLFSPAPPPRRCGVSEAAASACHDTMLGAKAPGHRHGRRLCVDVDGPQSLRGLCRHRQAQLAAQGALSRARASRHARRDAVQLHERLGGQRLRERAHLATRQPVFDHQGRRHGRIPPVLRRLATRNRLSYGLVLTRIATSIST